MSAPDLSSAIRSIARPRVAISRVTMPRIEAPGLRAMFRKELSDHLGSRRAVILFALIVLTGTAAVYVSADGIKSELSGSSAPPHAFLLLFTLAGGPLPSFLTFIGFLGPLVGLALAFDAVNGERLRGTLSHLLAQPIHRDSVINGKFLAGLATVTGMLVAIVTLVASLGILRLGIVPTAEELLRLVAFIAVAVLYVGFWLGLALTLSVLIRQPATAALAGIAAWIFFAFFATMIADSVASAIVAIEQPDAIERVVEIEETRQAVARVSPATLFQEASVALLAPRVRTLGPLLVHETVGMVPNPLSLEHSLLLVWPQVVGLLALTAACFAVAYSRFMTQEIRSL